MIPPPHGFASAEDFIGYEKNITYLGRELCRSLPQSGPPSCPLWVKTGHDAGICDVRFPPKSGHCRTTLGCPLSADFVAKGS